MAARQTTGTRAKDRDRNDTCQILDSALADGQLPMEEHRTRVALATEAETLGDLQSLISDLQTANAPVQPPDLKKRPKMPGRRQRLGHARRGWQADVKSTYLSIGRQWIHPARSRRHRQEHQLPQ